MEQSLNYQMDLINLLIKLNKQSNGSNKQVYSEKNMILKMMKTTTMVSARTTAN